MDLAGPFSRDPRLLFSAVDVILLAMAGAVAAVVVEDEYTHGTGRDPASCALPTHE